jgi:hypothetical protein
MGKPQWVKLDHQLVRAVAIGPRPDIQLIAKVRGWQLVDSNTPPTFAGALVKIQPVAVRFEDGDRPVSLPIRDSTRASIGGIVAVALLVSIICWVTTALATRQIVDRKS